ncbi:MAG TPA: ABC transporter permease [Bryobacteraceae bacterium]
MSVFKKMRNILRNLFRSGHVERDLDDEIRSFAEMLDDENRARGLSAAEARRQAQIEVGGSAQVKEQVRAVRAGAWIEGLLQDLQYGARMLAHNGSFTAVALVTLALGIGANTALFSVVDALLLRGLPYRDADRLVYVSEFWPHEPVVPGPPSTDFAFWRAEAHTVDGLGAYGGGATLTLTGAGEPERIQGTMVTAGLLDLIGVRPALGRNFTAAEDRLGGPPAVILGHALWQRRFGSSPDIVGKMIELDGRGCTVAGVMGPDFLFPDNNFRGDLLVPMALPVNPNWRDEQHFRLLRVMVRRKPGVTPAAVRSEFTAILGRHRAEEAPQFAVMRKDMEVRATPLRDWLSGRIRTLVLVLQAAVAMVLLIGCLNVANL